MGRIVINQTENKQTIILNDSPEGIEGGFFDKDMNWIALYSPVEIPVKEKTGLTGAGEVANEARALSAVIPITNEAVNYIQQYTPAGYKANIKILEGDTYVMDGDNPKTVVNVPTTVIGSSEAWSTYAFNNISGGVIGEKPTGQNWKAYTNADMTAIQFLFEKDNGTDATSAEDFDGYAVVSGVLYHLVGVSA